MTNEVVSNFRNSLSVNDLNDTDFMKIFSTKMEIKDVKYVNNVIFVLYQTLIAVIEIGHNEALNLRQ